MPSFPSDQSTIIICIALVFQVCVMCVSAAALNCTTMTGYSGAAGNCSCDAGFGGGAVAYSTITGLAIGCSACLSGTFKSTNDTQACTGTMML